MTVRTAELSPSTYARIAGSGYLLIIIAGIFAEFIIRGGLIVPGDAAATAGNIAASESLFRISLIGDLVMLACDVIVALALYVLLRPVSRGLALLATAFRLVHTAVYGANLLNLGLVVLALKGGLPGVFEPAQTQALVVMFIEAHQFGYALGLVFFGLHCLVLGYLIFRSGYFPKALGILLLVAGVGYQVDSLARIALTNYAAYEAILTPVVFIPALVGELSLALWLLVKGVPKQSAPTAATE